MSNERKKKVTISLSERSLAVMEALRELTDADTDSEVFRNALRLHLTLVRAEMNRVSFFMRTADDKETVLPVSMFAPNDLAEIISQDQGRSAR